MKPFSFLLLAFGYVILANAQSQSAAFVVAGIKDLSKASTKLNEMCQSLDIRTIFFTGPKVEVKIRSDIVQGIIRLTDAITESNAFDDADAGKIVDALGAFVEVQKQLLAVIIGKYGLLSSFDFNDRIRIALIDLEKAIDVLSISLIRLLPTRNDIQTKFQEALDVAVGQTIFVYGGYDEVDCGSALTVPTSPGKHGTQTAVGKKYFRYPLRTPGEYYEYYKRTAEYYLQKAAEYHRGEPKEYRVRGRLIVAVVGV